MKKRYCVYLILTMIIMMITGCDSMNQNSENDDVAIDSALDLISTIELYSEGNCKELLKSSDKFVELANIIKKNESEVQIIDGGWSVEMASSIDYSKYSKDEVCTVFIINFEKPIYLRYGDYDSNDDTVIGMFIVPEKEYIGLVIKLNDNTQISYVTLMNSKKNIFSEML